MPTLTTLARPSKRNHYTLVDHDFVMLDTNTEQQYVLRVRDLNEQDKPREKLLQLGAKNLSLPELIAVLWGVGTKKEELLSMSQRLVKEYGEKALVAEANPKNLAESLEIPLSKACQVVASFEIGRRFFASQAGKPVYVRNAQQAHQYLRGMGYGKKEQLRGLYLNSRYQVIRDEVISVGTLTSNLVHPREVFQPAIEHGAIAIIVAHNHPSGSLEPTNADIIITEQLLQAGKLLGIDLLDHLVLAENKFISVMECMRHDLQTQAE
ncbi:MAG: repair protein RadC [Patescibacteria group bacterium]|nr:repair protein RadC [Patescibacteria group bacterium]